MGEYANKTACSKRKCQIAYGIRDEEKERAAYHAKRAQKSATVGAVIEVIPVPDPLPPDAPYPLAAPAMPGTLHASATTLQPIDIEALPKTPRVLRNVGTRFWELYGLDMKKLMQDAKSKTTDLKDKLDMTNDGLRRAIAARMASDLLGEREDSIEARIAEVLCVNTHSVIGALPVATSNFRAHTHFLGVLHVAFGAGAKKVWTCTAPGDSVEVTHVQSEGDLFWLPPGWRHQVATTCGQARGRGDTDTSTEAGVGHVGHWITWCLPPCFCGSPLGSQLLLPFVLGTVSEGQAGRRFRDRKDKTEDWKKIAGIMHLQL